MDRLALWFFGWTVVSVVLVVRAIARTVIWDFTYFKFEHWRISKAKHQHIKALALTIMGQRVTNVMYWDNILNE